MSILCTIDEIYKYKGETYNPSDSDQVLQNEQYESLIEQVSAYIENICNRTFDSTVYVELYDGTGTNTIVLNQFPITALTRVRTGDDNFGWSEVDTDYIKIYYNEGKLINSSFYRDRIFPKGYQNVEISYTAGYSNIPEDLKSLCIKMVLDLKDISARSGGLKSEKQGDYSWTASDVNEVGAKVEYQNILNLYKSVV